MRELCAFYTMENVWLVVAAHSQPYGLFQTVLFSILFLFSCTALDGWMDDDKNGQMFWLATWFLSAHK